MLKNLFVAGISLAFSSIAFSAVLSSANHTTSTTFTPGSSFIAFAGCGISSESTARSYGTATFTTQSAGNYSFEVTASTTIVDPFMAVYEGSFDPNNPGANLVGCNDDGNGGGVGFYPVFSADLLANTTYVAVVTNFSGGASNGTISFNTGKNPDILLSNTTFDIGATSPTMTATSDSPVPIAYSSSNTSVATINANTGALTLVGLGQTNITASQAAESDPLLYRAGAVTRTLTVTVPPPTVTAVNPNTGLSAGGTAITITGTELTGATVITVGGAACTSIVASATSATCTTSARAAGSASVLVTTPGGTNAANTLFTYQTNAVCGTAASVASSIVPSGNLCTVGTAGQVSSSLGQYSWTCSGISGGTNASCTAPWATNAGTGSGSLSTSGNGWTVSSASFAATPTTTPPAGVTFPNGLLDLRLSTGTSGSNATVVVNYSTAVPAGAVYMKYGKTQANQTDHWYELPANRAVFSQDRMSVTLTLTDGGVGDHDLAANGTIVDPGGPALVPAPSAIPTLSEWAMILLASLMGLFAYSRMRRPS